MTRYSSSITHRIRTLRSEGKTYREIQKDVGLSIPKSTLSFICRGVILPESYASRVDQLNLAGLQRARNVAFEANKRRQQEFMQVILKRNTPVAKTIHSTGVAKVALAMLCLGEASKYNPSAHRSFSLGNSDPRIIILFLGLLQRCFPFNIEKVRATVQCRADQHPEELKRFWIQATGIPERLFYKPLVDPRTRGKPTKKPNYRGVLRVDYFDSKIQRELESLADLLYNQIRSV